MLLSDLSVELTFFHVDAVQSIQSAICPPLRCQTFPRRCVAPHSTRSPFSYPRQAKLLSADSAFSMLARPSVTFGPKYEVKLIAPTREEPRFFTRGNSTLLRIWKIGVPESSRA